ncbi:ParA family protein [Borrelia turicatae]|uniref:ParA family protein n=1 Tax=Borrelia turicatae TaxID=142 RepID=UPI0032B23D20
MNCKLKDKFVDSLDKSYSVLYTNKETVINFFLIVLIKTISLTNQKNEGFYTLKKRTKIITIASIKGRVEKNTSAILFSTIISKKSSVLLIDMDSQASLTSYFNEYLEKARINVENTIYMKS